MQTTDTAAPAMAGSADATPLPWAFGDLVPLRYGAILADPPWYFRNYSAAGEVKNPTSHYACMSTDDIAALPVNQLAAPDCALFMWATAPMLPDALRLMKAWGFTFKSAGAWAKQSSTGQNWAFGTGYCFRSAAEFYLLGTIGKPKVCSRSIRNLIVAPVREHSRKPDDLHAHVEALYSGPYAELFARESRPCPPDFLDVYRQHGGNSKRMMAHYGVGAAYYTTWLQQHGLHKPRNWTVNRTLPEDFAEHAAVYGDAWLRAKYHVGEAAITRWRAETGTPVPNNPAGRKNRLLPRDFAAMCRDMTISALMRHYSAADTTVRRWCREANVRPKADPGYKRGLPVSTLPPVDDSLLGQAKQHLRKFYPSVHGAEILPAKERRHLPAQGKGMVIIGGKGALPAAEVIALAESRGFDPRGWARI